jgi:hypothetical protein
MAWGYEMWKLVGTSYKVGQKGQQISRCSVDVEKYDA